MRRDAAGADGVRRLLHLNLVHERVTSLIAHNGCNFMCGIRGGVLRERNKILLGETTAALVSCAFARGFNVRVRTCGYGVRELTHRLERTNVRITIRNCGRAAGSR